MKSIIDLLPKRVVDPKALTINEIVSKTPGFGRSSVDKMIRERIKSGEAEQVWKKVGTKYVPAYRAKK